jgi:phosphomannomutase
VSRDCYLYTFIHETCGVYALKVFGTAGIRRKYPDVLDPILAYRIGLSVAFVNHNTGDAYIVYDTRETRHLFTASLAAGLMAGGLNIYIVGLAPTPVAGYAALKNRGLGVSITASHNPPEYNGFKFYDSEGYEYTRTLEREIEDLLDRDLKPLPWDKVGKTYSAPSIVDTYIEDLIGKIGMVKAKWNPYIVLDLANGAAYNVTPRIVRILGGKPLTINANPDGHFPIRPPEPRKDVLESYLSLYRQVNPAVILAHDGDADRLAALDPVEGFIRQDRIIAFYAYLLLRERKGHVIVSIDTGKVVDDVVEKMGGSVERYILGKTHERVKELGAGNIVLAAEPWKLIDPRWGPWVDGIWQAALITKTIVEEGKPFSKILDEYGIPDYPWDRRSYLIEPIDKRDEIYDELVEELSHLLGEPSSIQRIDGVRYDYPDNSWILVRKSGTEPKIRVYMEAMSRDRLKIMIERVEKLIHDTVVKHGGRIAEKTIG